MIANITADGETVAIRTFACPDCPQGVKVQTAGDRRYIGHVATMRHGARRYALTWTAIVSMTCPGDVRPSTAHGVLLKGKYRMTTYGRGLRALVSLRDS